MTQRKGTNLSSRLGFASLALTMLLSAILSGVVGTLSTASLEDDIGANFAELAHQMADKLDQAIYERYSDVQYLANDATIRGSAAAADKRALLEQLQRSFPDYAWIGFADAAGTISYSTRGLLEGRNVRERPWFQEAQSGPYIGDVHEAVLLASLLPESGGQPPRFVDIAVPLRDEQGQLLGVLGAHLYVRWADSVRQSLFTPLEQRRNVEMLIVGPSGTLVLGSGQPPAVTALLASATPSDGGPSYAVQQDSQGTAYLTGYAPTRRATEYTNLDWTVVVRQPTAVAFAPARQLQLTILVAGVVLGLTFGGLGWLMARRTTAPLLAIAAAAERVRQGDRSVTLPIFDYDTELQNVSETLRDLVATLTQHEADIERLYTGEHAARLAAEAAVETREQFLSIASHELKTPLTVLLGQAQLLERRTKRGAAPAALLQSASAIMAQGHRLDAMIGQMLDLSRLQQGQFQIARAPTDVAALAEQAVAELRPTAENHSIALEVRERPLVVNGDALRLAQVLHNLIHNAIKYSPHGGNIAVTAERRGREIRVTVADSGIGIPAAALPRLFERFYRADNVDALQISGFGIGLYVCQEIARRHGGTIEVTSVEGAGSTFMVCLPAAEAASDTVEQSGVDHATADG